MALKPRGLVSICRSLHFGQQLNSRFCPQEFLVSLKDLSASVVETNEDALLCLSALSPLGKQALPLIKDLLSGTTVRNASDLQLLVSAICGVSDVPTARVLAGLVSEISASSDFQQLSNSDRLQLRLATHRLRRFVSEMAPEKISLREISDRPPCEQLSILAETGQLQDDRNFLVELCRQIRLIQNPTMLEISHFLKAVHVAKVRKELSGWLMTQIGNFIDKFPIPDFARASRMVGEYEDRPDLSEQVFARLKEFPDELTLSELERHVFRCLSFRGRSEIFQQLISGKKVESVGLGFLCAAAESEISLPEISVESLPDLEKLPLNFVARLLMVSSRLETWLQPASLSEILARAKFSDLSQTTLTRLCLAGKVPEKLKAQAGSSETLRVAFALGKGELVKAKLAMIDLVDKMASDETLKAEVRRFLSELPCREEEDGEYAPFDVFNVARKLYMR